MTSSAIQFIWNNKILKIDNPDPNETLLNFIRLKIKKKQELKKGVPKEDVVLVQ